MLGGGCAPCLTADGAKALACEPWHGQLPSGARTASLLVPYMSAGIGPRRVMEFKAPVIVLGMHVSAHVLAGSVPADGAWGLLARLDLDHDTACLTSGGRNEAPFVALRSLDVSVRALDLVLDGPHPEIGVTLRPLVDQSGEVTQAPWPAVISFIYRPIGWE